jgi:endogenous inhibitor of DNA gyrase (YacG/DUF329 family)
MPDDRAGTTPKPPPCPICAKPARHEFRPFCSKRCSDVDLGRWLKGGYAIPGDPVPEDELPGAPDPDGVRSGSNE